MSEGQSGEQPQKTVAELLQQMPKRAVVNATKEQIEASGSTQASSVNNQKTIIENPSRRQWFGRVGTVLVGVALGLGLTKEGQPGPDYVETQSLLERGDFPGFYRQTLKNYLNLDPVSLGLIDSVVLTDLDVHEPQQLALVGDRSKGEVTPAGQRFIIECKSIAKMNLLISMPIINLDIDVDGRIKSEYLNIAYNETSTVGRSADIFKNRDAYNLIDPENLQAITQKRLKFPPSPSLWLPSSATVQSNPDFREIRADPAPLAESAQLAGKLVSYFANTQNDLQINVIHNRHL